MKRADFRFADSLRVRWAEVDMQKVVFNSHYLAYVDAAMGNYWRALALPYEETLATLGGDLFVRKATLDYNAPARYGDTLAVGIRFETVGRSSLHFAAAIFRGEELLATCGIVYVWTDAITRQPAPVPASLIDTFRAHSSGEPMVLVELGNWEALSRDALAIRMQVFVDEPKVPADLEHDGDDATALHALARNRLGLPIGTGRLLPGAPARIGRMAVRRELRGANVGRSILSALTSAAARRGDAEVVLHAQVDALGFYARAGFVAHGPVFDEVGIAHRDMRLALRALRDTP